MNLRLIGDIHGNYEYYLTLLKDTDYSIQVGDLGFRYDWMSKVDLARHRFFGGNHDNYNLIQDCPHSLGDFGLITHIPQLKSPIFFVRGAWSIDKKYRRANVDWWRAEELSIYQCEEAIKAYAAAQPDILLSHECPFHVLPEIVTDPTFALDMGFDKAHIETRTNLMLDAMYERHRPSVHVFGHYHKDFDRTINGTRYVCVTGDPNMLRLKQKFLDLDIEELL